MAETPEMTAEEAAKKAKKLSKHCMNIYVIYAASAATQLYQDTMVLGILFLIIALILNVSGKFKKEVKDTPFASHQRWMYRTFWIGTGILMPIAMGAATYIIAKYTDAGTTISAMMSGNDPDAAMSGAQNLMAQLDKASYINVLCMAPVVLWWVRRCWTGYKLAEKGLPVDNVTSWL